MTNPNTAPVDQVGEKLAPCPFCGDPLTIRRSVNPSARCDTDGCWMSDRAISIPLDWDTQVEQWNTRATTAPLQARVEELEAKLANALAAAIRALSTTPATSRLAELEAENARLIQRIGELTDEGDGFWRACSGCQESVDGCVSSTDYPYSQVFRCQPGGGCGECGGIGVIWDDTDYDEYARAVLNLEGER